MRTHAPSATARLIVAGTAFLSCDSRYAPLIPKLAAEASTWFLQTGATSWAALLPLMDRRWFRSVVSHVERATVPGILLHYQIRKRWIEDQVRACLTEGADQVIVLGAGFDTLALRLHHEFPHVRFFELDHSATQQVKRQALAGRGMLAGNLEFVSGDLTKESWTQTLLSQSSYRNQANTLLLAESVLMYLQPHDLDRVFEFLHGQTGRYSRLLFTFMEPTDDGRVTFCNQTRLVDFWLWWRKEPFTWGMRRAALSEFLSDKNFFPLELASAETLRNQYFNASDGVIPLAEGEYLCLAERTHHGAS